MISSRPENGVRPRATVGLLSWNGRHHLEHCLPALEAQLDPGMPWEVVVLDNASSDGTASWLRSRHPGVRVVQSAENLGFCAGYNRLVRESDSEFFVLLNDDTRPRVDWLRVLLGALEAAPADVAAVGGVLVDWSGERLDFGRGILTFDGHALQRGFGADLARARSLVPRAGEDILFPCGGNMATRRSSFLSAGGFDVDYFAYYEDVDLGWRLWAGGERVISEPAAVAEHRSSGSSDRLGSFKRGFLFERNAFRTAFKNFDAVSFEAWMPSVLLTLLARTQRLLIENNPGGPLIAIDPYRQPDPLATAGPAAKPSLRHRVRRRLLRLLRGVPREDSSPGVRLSDPRTLAQLRAIQAVLGSLDGLTEARATVQARRRRSDAELFARFPLHLVPTYPGDVELFRSAGFRALLPRTASWVEASLDQLAATDLLPWEMSASGS